MNYFKDMIERGHLNTDNGLQMECLWICFSALIQKDLDLVKEQWNTHRIRASRHDTVAGIPDELYHLPERHGGVDGLAFNVSEDQISFAKENFLEYEVESNMFEEYFSFVLQNIAFSEPESWEEAENMYFTLVSIASNTD